MAETIPAVKFTNVSFGYDHIFQLKGISFAIETGDFVSIIGPNGSGKTTLLKLILGMMTPQEGNIDVFGLPPHKALHRMGYVPQRLHVDPEFPITVLELVLTGRLSRLSWSGRYRPEDYQIAEDALKTVAIADLAGRPFGTLSTGQAQRALIARALAGGPELLVLDEPTANVDPSSARDIHQILKTLTQGMTIIMVTHNIDTVIHDTQKVLCVQDGVVELSPEQVCEHFAIGLYHTPLINTEGS